MNMVNTNCGLLFVLVSLMALQNQMGHMTELGMNVANKKCFANNQCCFCCNVEMQDLSYYTSLVEVFAKGYRDQNFVVFLLHQLYWRMDELQANVKFLSG